MVKFLDVVKIRAGGCAKCVSATYILPCQINKDLARFLVSFGSPLYNLEVVKLFRINTKDGFKIEAKIGTKIIKLSMPKEFKKMGVNNIPKKIEFEKCLVAWMTDILDINIEY